MDDIKDSKVMENQGPQTNGSFFRPPMPSSLKNKLESQQDSSSLKDDANKVEGSIISDGNDSKELADIKVERDTKTAKEKGEKKIKEKKQKQIDPYLAEKKNVRATYKKLKEEILKERKIFNKNKLVQTRKTRLVAEERFAKRLLKVGNEQKLALLKIDKEINENNISILEQQEMEAVDKKYKLNVAILQQKLAYYELKRVKINQKIASLENDIMQEKPPMSKKMKIAISLIVVIPTVLLCCTLGIWQYVLATTKLPMPTGLRVYSAAGKTYLSVDENVNAEGYIFYIRRNNDGEEFSIFSRSPVFDLTNYMQTPANYYLSVRYAGRTTKALSDKIKYYDDSNGNGTYDIGIDANYYKKMQALDIPIIQTVDNNTYMWVGDTRAIEYYVYYNATSYFRATKTINNDNWEFSLSTIQNDIGIPAGAYVLRICAIGNGTEYYDSDFSTPINYVKE